MKIFVYEHFSSGALIAQDFSKEMLEEGDAMLSAISQDLVEHGHHVYQLRDARLAVDDAISPVFNITGINTKAEFEKGWEVLTEKVDATLIIAPETDGVLTQCVIDLERRGRVHLNAESDAIALCSDKLRCARFLKDNHISTPQTWSASNWLKQGNATSQWVVKPRDGAGCENTFVFDTQACAAYLAALAKNEQDNTVVQPYISGTPMSLSLFVHQGQAKVISVNYQHISENHSQLKLSHIETNKTELLSEHSAQQLSAHLAQVLPGLQGFIGIDMIKHEDGLSVIDINPRLTSAYPALNPQQKAQFFTYFEEALKQAS